MLNSIKLYFYGAVAFAIGLFIIIFRLRGSKIETLQEKVKANKQKYKTDIKIAKFEARNQAKAEETKKDEDITTITNGSYTL